MKHLPLLTISLSATMFFSACNSGNVEQSSNGMVIIDVENPTIKECPPNEQLIDTMYLIPLQSDTAYIKQFFNSIKAGDRIYVADAPFVTNEPVKIFDDKGNFVNELHKGQGPGEIDQYYDMFFDGKRQNLVVAHPLHWSLFDRDGKFVDKVKLPFKYNNCIRIGDEYVFYTMNNQLNDSIKSMMFVTDAEFNVLQKFFPYERVEGPAIINPHEIFFADNHISVLRDTIYYYQDSKLTPAIYFKYPQRLDYSMLNGDLMSMDQHDGYYRDGFVENSGTAIYKMVNLYKKESKKVIYSKKSGNYVVLNFKNNEDEPFFVATEENYDDYFTVIINDTNYDKYHEAITPFLSNHDKEIINSYNPDNNPIIVMFKFKDF
ncbi:MAG: 6-bladed beta-propeller [Bacteroidales bacterium]|nr:6-bladed beta-propeller [Bacteroidales bacterium]